MLLIMITFEILFVLYCFNDSPETTLMTFSSVRNIYNLNARQKKEIQLAIYFRDMHLSIDNLIHSTHFELI